jgi:putative nucleotidyltransferase with HDIG domain
MLRNPSDTLYIQKQFRGLNNLLLKTLGELSQIADPNATVAIQDLKKIADSLEKLQTGGHIMNSSMGLNRVLEEVMDALISLMHAERGFLMLRNEQGELVVRIARGIAHDDLEKEMFELSRTIIKQVAASGEAVLTTNAQEDPRYEKQFSVIALSLRSILCAPLKLKNEVIGVIFVDNRVKAGLFQEKDLEMLSAFADQAAISIDNARLFDDLQASNKNLEAANIELETAYEATLNGWVRALDLRDKETEGHTQRVTALTLRLAIHLGVSVDDLVHITRGALLHDIGKMGIPDGILLKPSGLTDEERELMKQHTILAYEMLSRIQFLHKAIDIPYCHHEKWDGSGYPRGLHGEEIPFMARIFSIVDVWDALTSNRPYRKPVDPAEVRQYIREQSGLHFDPQLVDAFLGMNLAI